MYELKKKIGKVFASKSVGTGPSSYEKKNLPGRGLTKIEKHCNTRIKWSNSGNVLQNDALVHCFKCNDLNLALLPMAIVGPPGSFKL